MCVCIDYVFMYFNFYSITKCVFNIIWYLQYMCNIDFYILFTYLQIETTTCMFLHVRLFVFYVLIVD